MIGALIVSHGDDDGLKLPPPVAPIQIVCIPIAREEAELAALVATLDKLKDSLPQIRFHIDARPEVSIGFKRNEWELKGVPVRLEFGKQEAEKGVFGIARRDIGEKSTIPLADAEKVLPQLLETITSDMYQAAQKQVASSITEVTNFTEFEAVMAKGGYAKAYFCEDIAMEKEIQEKTKATTRVVVMEPTKPGVCFYSGKKAERQWYFAKAY